MTITIYHNPKCGTSRNTLGLIKNTGAEPIVIEYLKQVPSAQQLRELIAAMGLPVRDIMRKKENLYQEMQLDDQKWTDEQLIDVMLQNPILINRPIVVTTMGTKLCRPSELVLDILPLPQLGAFSKEDGEQLLDASGQRLK